MRQHGFALPRQSLARFLSGQNGSMLPLAAAAMLSLAGFVGIAVDGARMVHGRDVLQKALDAAGLAAGHAAELSDMTGDGAAFFATNVAAGGSSLIDPTLDMTISADNSVITLSARADIDTTFMRLFGFDQVTVSAVTEVTRETRGMELALVMDNTGSMRSGGKIGAMKSAAQDLVEIVYGDDETNPNLWVSVIPYTATVNIGAGRTGWLTASGQGDVSGGSYNPTSWKGCVMARGGAGDRGDDTPDFDPFIPYFWEDSVDNDWVLSGGGFDLDETNGAQNDGRGPNLGCGPAITPLTAAKTTISAAIDEMLPWHRGGTASNLGLVWGWRTLSPSWRGLWGGATPTALPLDYDEPFMDKVIVVLTDGQNQFYDHQGGGPQGSDFTAYDRLEVFGFSSLNDARAELDSRFATLCQSIKDTGIIIYAITFGGTPNSSTQSLYRGCASRESFYYHAPDNDELQDVFRAIGRQLSNLRLSQ